MDEMDILLDQYRNRFKENFPLMLCRHMDDEEIIELLQKHIESGKPYAPELDPDANY